MLEAVARITEIFVSIQGEGLLLTTPMIFVRFGGCHLRCLWCDEPNSLPMNSGQLMTVPAVINSIEKLSSPPIQWISLTGGEPLLQTPFLNNLCPKLKEKGFKILLETGGTLYQQFSETAPWIDLVSMDIKLPSALDLNWPANFPGSGGSSRSYALFERHERFLSMAPARTCVKIVVSRATEPQELLAAFRLLQSRLKIPLVVIQPATPVHGISPPTTEQLKNFQALAWENLPQPIRLMPQYHPLWKIP